MINLAYPELRFSSASLDRLSDAERSEPVTSLGLSTRTKNVLLWRKAETLGKLKDLVKGDQGIGVVRNFGKKSHEELVHAILALSEAVDEKGEVDWKKYSHLARKKFVGMRVNEAARFLGLPYKPELALKRVGWPRPFGEIPEAFIDRPLHSLPFSNRAFIGLKSMGALKIGDVMRISPTDLLKVKNVGKKTIQEIFETISSIVTTETSDNGISDPLSMNKTDFPLVPMRENGSPEQYYTDFFKEILKVFADGTRHADITVLKKRLLCPLGKEWTLDKTGKRVGLTRERIRQCEARLVAMFKASLLEGKYTYELLHPSKGLLFAKSRFCVHPKFQEMCKRLKNKQLKSKRSLETFNKWIISLARTIRVKPALVKRHGVFWLHIFLDRPARTVKFKRAI
jgi:hypothetical protein